MHELLRGKQTTQDNFSRHQTKPFYNSSPYDFLLLNLRESILFWTTNSFISSWAPFFQLDLAEAKSHVAFICLLTIRAAECWILNPFLLKRLLTNIIQSIKLSLASHFMSKPLIFSTNSCYEDTQHSPHSIGTVLELYHWVQLLDL